MKILITTDWYTPAVNGAVTSGVDLRRFQEANMIVNGKGSWQYHCGEEFRTC